jgi:hypothetical protein
MTPANADPERRQGPANLPDLSQPGAAPTRPAAARGRVVKLRPEEKPPPTLGAEEQRMWRDYLADFELDHAGRVLLCLALESHGRMREAQEVIKREGLVAGSKMNPAIIVERDSRLAMLKALRQLGLDVEPVRDRPGRPPGRKGA